MTVSRDGRQLANRTGHRSHTSGKRQNRFAARIKENLDEQCKRLEAELNPKEKRKESEHE